MVRVLSVMLAAAALALSPNWVSAASHPKSMPGHRTNLPPRAQSSSQDWLDIQEVQAQKPGSAADANLVGTGALTSASTGNSVTFYAYYTFSGGPKTINETITSAVFLGNKRIAAPGPATYTVPNNGKNWYYHYGPVKLTQAGTYYFWVTFAVGSQSFSVRSMLPVH